MAKKGDHVDILYVEDDDVDIMAMQREFHRVNDRLKIAVAKDGEQALDMIYGRNGQNKITPSVILLDLNMPNMNGIEFLEKLRNDFNFVDVKVFVLTGAYTTKDKLATNDMNVSGCIIKPIQHEDALNIFWCISADAQSAKLLF